MKILLFFSPMKEQTILMVCLGNICRSPLAEGILSEKCKHLNVIVDSAGTSGNHIGEKPDPRSVHVATYNLQTWALSTLVRGGQRSAAPAGRWTRGVRTAVRS